jgi:hypothetical protein
LRREFSGKQFDETRIKILGQFRIIEEGELIMYEC